MRYKCCANVDTSLPIAFISLFFVSIFNFVRRANCEFKVNYYRNFNRNFTFCKFKVGSISGASLGSSITSRLLHHATLIKDISHKFCLLTIEVSIKRNS